MSAPELRLERRDQADKTTHFGNVMLTPALGEDYWAYRVLLSPSQAIVGFPKFFTTGIGFAVEEDWNTNLPYTCETEEIFAHIAHNKGDDSISDDDVREAIRMVREAAAADAELARLAAHRDELHDGRDDAPARCEDEAEASGQSFFCTLNTGHAGLHAQLTPTGAFMAEWGFADGHVHTTAEQPASVTA